jgi:hypothetical protein
MFWSAGRLNRLRAQTIDAARRGLGSSYTYGVMVRQVGVGEKNSAHVAEVA